MPHTLYLSYLTTLLTNNTNEQSIKELGESLIPGRTPKDKAEQFDEVEASSMVAFSYTVKVYKSHNEVTKKRSDLETLAVLEKVSPGSTLYFYKCRDPKMGHVLVTRSTAQDREREESKEELPPMDDDHAACSANPQQTAFHPVMTKRRKTRRKIFH